MLTNVFRAAALICAPMLLCGQDDGTVAPVFFFGGGGTFTNNRLNDYVKNGYHFTGGGGVRAMRSIEFLGEFSYHELGVQDTALVALQVPDGSSRILSLTGNVKVPLMTGRVRPYVIGGGGWYRRTVEFTEPSTGLATIFDPWWGYLGDVVVPTNRVLGSVTRNAPGVNAGVGVSFDIGERSHLFAQIRWHRAFHNPTNTTIVPITVGLSF